MHSLGRAEVLKRVMGIIPITSDSWFWKLYTFLYGTPVGGNVKFTDRTAIIAFCHTNGTT